MKIERYCIYLLIAFCLFSSCIKEKQQRLALSDVKFCGQPLVDSLAVHKNQMFIRQSFNPKTLQRKDGVLVIDIYKVENPDLIPLTFSVNIELSNKTIPLGTLSLYPPNRPGVFKFRVPNILELKTYRSAWLIVKLLPQEKQMLSPDLMVSFSEFAWE